MKLIACIVTITAFLSSLALAGTLPSIPDEALRVQRAYDGLKDIKGDFVQKSFIKDLKKTSVFRGAFLIKRPSLMRWNYEEQEIAIDGEEILIYQKKDRQAFRGRFDRETYGRTPIALLSGFADIGKEFEITKKGEGLLLKPLSPMGGITNIEIKLSRGAGFPISSFKVTDSYSNTVEISLENVETNTGVVDSDFELSLPKGVKAYEYNP